MSDRQLPTGDPVLGRRLRTIRERSRLSVHDVEILSRGDIKASTLSAYERGDRALSVSRLMRLGEFYGVSIAQLLEPDVIDLRDDVRSAAGNPQSSRLG
jgi:transcriptional regulator with XRE-family HTH domain